jgi:hypothetical protein
LIASWTSFSNDWIEKIVEDGNAESEPSQGYPITYRVKAKYVLPLLMSELVPHSDVGTLLSDDDPTGARYSKKIEVNQGSIEIVRGEDMLIIEAWDQS